MVTVTDGRIYNVESMELHPDIVSGVRRPLGTYDDGDPWLSWGAYRSDFVVVKTPIVVPDGKWVIEPTTVALRQPIGITFDEIEQIKLDFTQSLGIPARTLWVSDKPFGLVSCSYDDHPVFGWKEGDKTRTRYLVAAEWMRFQSACQIHKGELGQSLPVPRLGRYGTVAWGEIADELGMSIVGLSEKFRPFIGWSICREMDSLKPEDVRAYRVNRGLAHAILRLAALGFTSELLPA